MPEDGALRGRAGGVVSPGAPDRPRDRTTVSAGVPVRVLLAGAAALLACGPDEPPEPVATDRVETPPHYRFEPRAAAVKVGDEVRWVNTDDFTHSVRFEGRDTVLELAPGDSASLRFERPGTFPYVCTFHPHDMRGRIVVRGG